MSGYFIFAFRQRQAKLEKNPNSNLQPQKPQKQLSRFRPAVCKLVNLFFLFMFQTRKPKTQPTAFGSIFSL
jgi:hypothetical protein